MCKVTPECFKEVVRIIRPVYGYFINKIECIRDNDDWDVYNTEPNENAERINCLSTQDLVNKINENALENGEYLIEVYDNEGRVLPIFIIPT